MKVCLSVLMFAAVVAGAAARPAARLQAPDSKPAPTTTPAIGVRYLEPVNQTEVSLHLTPRSPKGEPVPADVVFVALFNGNVTKSDPIVDPPDWLNIQAQASPLIVHSSRAFSLVIPGLPTIDLLAPPAKVFEGYACDQCGLTELRVPLDPKILLEIAHARSIAANLFGMDCELHRADIDAIATFARKIQILI